jgi:hypothetical protein
VACCIMHNWVLQDGRQITYQTITMLIHQVAKLLSINIWLILGGELPMLCGKTAKIIYKINLYCLWFVEFLLYCNKDMCVLMNFHFIVIRTYVWLAEFHLL